MGALDSHLNDPLRPPPLGMARPRVTAQPKPTAADVLREHYAVDRQPFGRPAYRQCTCGWAEDVNRRGFPQHQADMLAAAGLLATAEHDAQVAAQALRDLVSDRADIEEALAKIADTEVSAVDLIVYHVNAEADRIAGGTT